MHVSQGQLKQSQQPCLALGRSRYTLVHLFTPDESVIWTVWARG
jgi:hypothetical protein